MGYAGYNDTSVFPFNPTTGEVGSALSQLNRPTRSVTVATSGGLNDR